MPVSSQPEVTASLHFSLAPEDNARLQAFCGVQDQHLQMIERHFGVRVARRGFTVQLSAFAETTQPLEVIQLLIEQLYEETASQALTPEQVHLALNESKMAGLWRENGNEADCSVIAIKTKRGLIRPRGAHQQAYLKHIMQHDISFGIGPAGTGKTFLAVAAAVQALERQDVKRLLLTRPAVEAGEKLGFLPGDLGQKIEPYLRPLYDALFEMLGFERVEKLMERKIIEIAPLAYMRGRTLNDAFIILDESQNTTTEQMKMFLTRIGFNSKAVITGDVTQVDLPRGQKSGLKHAMEVLVDVPELSFNYFDSHDIVRHPVVAKVVQAYDKWEQAEEARRQNRLVTQKAYRAAQAQTAGEVAERDVQAELIAEQAKLLAQAEAAGIAPLE